MKMKGLHPFALQFEAQQSLQGAGSQTDKKSCPTKGAKMPKLAAPPPALPRSSNWSLELTLFPHWCSSLPVAFKEPTSSQRLLADRYVIAPSTSLPLVPKGRGGHNVTGKGRHFDWATLVTGAEAAAQVVPVSPPPSLLRLNSRAPNTSQSWSRHVPETRRGEPCGGDRRGEAGEMEGVRAGELGATVMGRETVSHQCGLVAMVSGSAGVGHFLRHAGWASTQLAALELISWAHYQSVPSSFWLANRPTAQPIEAVLSLAQLGCGAGVWKDWVNERGPVVPRSVLCFWIRGG